MLVNTTTETFNKNLEVISRESLAQMHEMIHHIQLLSSPAAMHNENSRLKASAQFLRSTESAEARVWAKEIKRLDAFYSYKLDGISVLDLMEGAAALESLKMVYGNLSVNNHLAYLNKYHPGKGNSVYRRTLDTMRRCCSQEAAFDLLPVISYLSLQSSTPGRAFEYLLRRIERRADSFVGLPASEIVKELGYSTNLIDIFRAATSIPHSERHLALFPLFASLAQNIDLDLLLEYFARPGTMPPKCIKWLRPPLVIGAYPDQGKKGLNMYGPVTNMPQVQNMVICAAFVAAADTVVNPSERHIPCQTTDCPNYGCSFCSGFFTPNGDASGCLFRNEIIKATGKEPAELETFLHRLLMEKSNETTSHLQPEDIFDQFSELPHVNRSFASTMDEDLLLDPVDNDNPLMIRCSCGPINVMVPNIAMKRGFSYTCSKCGKVHDISLDTTSIYDDGEREKYY